MSMTRRAAGTGPFRGVSQVPDSLWRHALQPQNDDGRVPGASHAGRGRVLQASKCVRIRQPLDLVTSFTSITQLYVRTFAQL